MKNKFLLLLVIGQVILFSNIKAQSVAINSTGAVSDASAMLDISSDTKGLLIPRMTTVQLTAILLPATGLLVYDLTANLYKTNIGTPAAPSWVSLLTTSAGNWTTVGNTPINSGNQFLGSINNASLRFRTNNVERMVMDSVGNLGVGTATPTAVVHLKAGTASASSAPLKFTSGTNVSIPENGAVEFDGTNYFATSGGVRYTLAKTLTGSAILDFPNTGAFGTNDRTIAVAGAADGDVVSLGTPAANMITGALYTAFVSAPGIVTVRFANAAFGAIDPPSATFKVSVIKF